jgi:hypothetical protein
MPARPATPYGYLEALLADAARAASVRAQEAP